MKFVIDAGHGKYTAGKRAPDDSMREFHFNSVVAKYVADDLKQYKNVETLFTHDPSGETDVPLITRTNKANSWGAKAFISIHANAFRGVWHTGGGIETYVYTTKPQGSTQLANQIQKELVKETGLYNRGVKFANFHVLRESKMDAILAECGFMDSKVELALLKSDNYRRKCAKAIVKGIVSHYGLIKSDSKPSNNKPTTNTKPSVKPSSKPTVASNSNYKGNSLVDYLKSIKVDSSFANRTKLAAKYKISGYKGTLQQNESLLSKMRGNKTSKPTSKPINNSTSTYSGRGVKSKVNGLRYYNKPSWSDKDVVGSLNVGIGFPTIVKKVKVDNGEQYQVKNSKGNTYYVTASSKYVVVK